MKIQILTVLLIFSGYFYAQDPCDVASRNLITYLGSSNDDQAYVVEHLGEFGYFVGGSKMAGGSRYTQLARLDLCGEVIWQNVYNAGEFGIPASAVLKDGEIYVSLYQEASYKTSLLKLNLDGSVIDAKQFGGGATYPRSMIETSDDQLLYCGVTNVPGGMGGNDVYVVKTTFDGSFTWQFRMGGSSNEFGYNVFEDSSGDIIALGYTRDYIPGVHRGVAFKLNSEGTILWCKEYHNGAGYSYLHHLIEHEGFYYGIGNCNNETSGDLDGMLLKLSMDGEVIWSRFIGGSGEDKFNRAGILDGKIYVSGTVENESSTDAVIASFDLDGNLLEHTALGTASDELSTNAFKPFGIEEDGFYGITGGDTELIGGDDILFYRFDDISSNCEAIDLDIFVIDADIIAEDKVVSAVSTSWSFTATTYTPTPDGLSNGIICSTIDEDVPCDVTAHFEFVINDFSSEDGAIGGCIANEITFNDLSTVDGDIITTWEWDFGDATTSTDENPTHTYDTEGTYTITLTVTTEDGCTHTTTLDIIISNSIDFDIIFNEPTCHGFSDGSITINVVGTGEGVTYEIKNDLDDLLNEDNSNTANSLPSGWYYLTITNEDGCAGVDSIFLDHPLPIEFDLNLQDAICFDSETGWARIDSVHNHQGDYGLINYIWTPNPYGENGIGADSTWSLHAGEYTVTVNDENGCSETSTFTIHEPPALFMSEFDYEPALCRLYGYQSGNGIVYGAAGGGTPGYNYLWTNLETGDTEINTTWGGLNPGQYVLDITDANGCTLSDTILVDSLNPESTFTITSDQLNEDCQGTSPVDISITNNSINFSNINDPFTDTTFFTNLYHPSGTWQISHDILETYDTTYLALTEVRYIEICQVALNTSGCSDTTCKTVTIYPEIKFVPINIFSPNNDGVNDLFTFEFKTLSITEFECTIVNRWGITIHQLNSITDGWNGKTKNGSDCPAGTYFYTYKAIAENSTIIEGQGTINLTR